jgi:hypothetical protein
MAVRLEHIDLLVPIGLIDEKYPGGFAQFTADNRGLIGRRMWHDGRLLRDGALDPARARALVEGWQTLGFEPLQWVDGRLHWKELCVVDAAAGGPTAACAWLDWDARARIAWLRGLDPGEIVGRW